MKLFTRSLFAAALLALTGLTGAAQAQCHSGGSYSKPCVTPAYYPPTRVVIYFVPAKPAPQSPHLRPAPVAPVVPAPNVKPQPTPVDPVPPQVNPTPVNIAPVTPPEVTDQPPEVVIPAPNPTPAPAPAPAPAPVAPLKG